MNCMRDGEEFDVASCDNIAECLRKARRKESRRKCGVPSAQIESSHIKEVIATEEDKHIPGVCNLTPPDPDSKQPFF